MDIRGIILYIIALLILILGFYILDRDKKNPINKSFFVIVIGVIIWICSNATISFLEDKSLIELFYRLTYVGGALLTGGFLFFAWVFPYKLSFIKFFRWIILLVPTLFFMAFSLVTDLVVSGVVRYKHNYDTTSGSLYGLYVAFFVVFFSWAFIELIRKYRRSDGMHLWQIKFVLISVLIPFVVGLITDLILPWLGYEKEVWMLNIGSMSSAVWLVLNGYILFKKQV